MERVYEAKVKLNTQLTGALLAFLGCFSMNTIRLVHVSLSLAIRCNSTTNESIFLRNLELVFLAFNVTVVVFEVALFWTRSQGANWDWEKNANRAGRAPAPSLAEATRRRTTTTPPKQSSGEEDLRIPNVFHVVNNVDFIAFTCILLGFCKPGHYVLINNLGDLINRLSSIEASLHWSWLRENLPDHFLSNYRTSILRVQEINKYEVDDAR